MIEPAPSGNRTYQAVYLVVVDRHHPLDIEDRMNNTVNNVAAIQRILDVLCQKNAIHLIVIELSYIAPILCPSRKEESNRYSRMIRLH